jgi:hypothetical protein
VLGFAQYDEFGCVSFEDVMEALSTGNSNCSAARYSDGL